MSLSISNLLSGYQNSYRNQLYRSVDRNYDNSYSRKEVENFAADYQKSTGSAVDVDELFNAYDVDLDGAFSSAEYKNVISDDALGMSALFGSEAETEPVKVEGTEESGSDLSSWMSSLSERTKNSLVQSTFKAETTGNLLNAMFGSNSLFASLNNAVSQYNSMKMYGAAQYMNSLGSSLNILV